MLVPFEGWVFVGTAFRVSEGQMVRFEQGALVEVGQVVAGLESVLPALIVLVEELIS